MLTIATLIRHLSAFPADAEVLVLEVTVVADTETGLLQTFSYEQEAEGDDGDDPDEEDLPERDPKVVALRRLG